MLFTFRCAPHHLLVFTCLVGNTSLALVNGQPPAGEVSVSSTKDSLTGSWVTNHGQLKLSVEGDVVTGTLDEKTSVAGKATNDRVSLQYKNSAVITNVTLTRHASGRWLSGESKSRQATAEWFGCREEAGDAEKQQAGDFSGHWLSSWGMLQLTQQGDTIDGQYGADRYGQVEGQIKGQRLHLNWRRHQSKGKVWIEQSPDGKQLIGRTIGTDKPSIMVGIRADGYVPNPKQSAGTTMRGIAENGMLYHLRMPDDWRPGRPTDVVVLLHGSNFTTVGMVGVVAKKWPSLAKKFAILGIQGERWVPGSTSKDLRFNYTYVNWMGRSTYRGFPYTDRESPALVMEVLEELEKTHSFERIFVGGHSQGGYLTYLLHMHFPEKLAGTFPIAGGIPIQGEPKAFADAALMESQRRTPMVIIHGVRDQVVNSSASDYAHRLFLGHDFPLVKRLSPNAGHAFDFLPVGEAVDWLAAVSSTDASVLAEFAAKHAKDQAWREVGGAILQAKSCGAEGQLRDSIEAYEEAAEQDAAKYLSAIKSNANGEWVEDYLQWNDQFSVAAAAQPAIAAFKELQRRHSKEATRLESAATKAFREKRTEEGWNYYREITTKYYAAPQFRTLVDRVNKHFDLK